MTYRWIDHASAHRGLRPLHGVLGAVPPRSFQRVTARGAGVDSQFFKHLIANCNTRPASGCKRVRMKLSIMFAALVGLVVGGGVARAERWDSKGWVKLGEREVNGRVDHDRIEVGRREGKFEKLTVVVLDSDLEMIDFEIKFGKGAPWHPELKHFFKEGQRTRVIDFPGDERTIKFIDFKYRNLPGGGRAKVQVWAR